MTREFKPALHKVVTWPGLIPFEPRIMRCARCGQRGVAGVVTVPEGFVFIVASGAMAHSQPLWPPPGRRTTPT